MRCYVTILDNDLAILPFFVRHYRRLGATVFPVTIYGIERENAGTEAAARKIIEAEGGEFLLLGSFKQFKFSAHAREAFIRDQHPAGEWAFFCDLDEFAEITPEFVQEVVAGEKPCSFVEGRWRDRVAAGGKLANIQAEIPLEQQFPLASNGRSLNQRLHFGGPCYVLSPFAPTSHHPNVCRMGRSKRGQSLKVTVHHFKWQANVVRRLERRLRRITRKGKVDSGWAARVRRKLKYLREHDGIQLNWLVEIGSVLGI
jgi:hypothetical protein